MPKINVYLPDDLAAAVRAAGIPVSAVCQQALAGAVRSVTEARKAISAIRSAGFDPARRPTLGDRLESRMTARLTEVFGLARRAGGGRTDTAHLLLGLLDEGHGLGLRLLQAMDIEPGEVRSLLRQPGADDDGDGDRGNGEGLTRQAWLVIAAAVEVSLDLGHNYLGTEHLVLGLLAEPDSAGGRALRRLGGDPDSGRKTLTSMLSGFAHARENERTSQAGAPAALAEIVRRLDALESTVAALGGTAGPGRG